MDAKRLHKLFKLHVIHQVNLAVHNLTMSWGQPWPDNDKYWKFSIQLVCHNYSTVLQKSFLGKYQCDLAACREAPPIYQFCFIKTVWAYWLGPDVALSSHLNSSELVWLVLQWAEVSQEAMLKGILRSNAIAIWKHFLLRQSYIIQIQVKDNTLVWQKIDWMTILPNLSSNGKMQGCQ